MEAESTVSMTTMTVAMMTMIMWLGARGVGGG
jgi:hypothetical protein